MSVWDLKVTIYIYMAIGVCVALYPRLLKDVLSRNVVIFWLALVPFLTIIRTPFVTFFAIIGFLYYIQRQVSNPQRLFIFMALLAAVPVWFKFMISAGAADIYEIRYWKLLVLVVLFPALLQLVKEKPKFDFVDVIFLFFVAYHILHYLFFNESLTFLTAVRLSADVFLYHFVIYYVFSRVVSHHPREAILYISYGFVILAIILSGVFVLNQVASVDLYRVHSTAGNIYNLGFLREYRGGFLRTEGTLSGETMGLLLGAGLLSLFSMRVMLSISALKLSAIAGLFFLAILITGSRGALFTFLLISLAFTYFHINNTAIKAASFLLICIVGVSYFSFFSGGLPVQDEFGTFDFRAQLWETSLGFVNKYPFGDSLYASHHYFDHMRRGPAQFLDIVSVYLEFWLPMGYPGLLLYVAPFLITVFHLVSLIFFKSDTLGVYGDSLKLYLPLLIGYLFMISTVSDVGLIGMLGIVFLAVSRGLIQGHAASQIKANI